MLTKRLTKVLSKICTFMLMFTLFFGGIATTRDVNAATATTPKLDKKTVTVEGSAKDKVQLQKDSYNAGWRIIKATVPKSKKNIAEVKVSSNKKVVNVTGKKKGSTKVTLKIKNSKTNKTKKLKFTVKVKTTPVTGVTIDQAVVTLEVEETLTLKATVTPKDATDKKVTWSSSKTKVAQVDANGKVTAMSKGTAVITAKAGKKTAKCKVKVIAKKNEKPTSKSYLVLQNGESKNLLATEIMSDIADKDVTWQVDKETVVKVENGIVTALAEGIADITAETDDKKVTWHVTVNEKTDEENSDQSTGTGTQNNTGSEQGTDVKTPDNTGTEQGTAVTKPDNTGTKDPVYNSIFIGDDFTLNIGETRQLKATVPSSMLWDFYNIGWSSSNVDVATVDRNGVVTAVSEGTASITASAAGAASGYCGVKVKSIEVTGITLSLGGSGNSEGSGSTGSSESSEGSGSTESSESVKSLELSVGGSETLTATVTPENATDKTVTWTSDKPEIATVSETGVIIAIAVGTATITATAGEKTATCTVTVKPIEVTGITLSLGSSESIESLELIVGGSETLTATVTPENATDNTVTWISSNQDVATVSETGVVTAVSVGEATITATAGEKTATCTVNVKPIEVTGITLSLGSSEGSGNVGSLELIIGKTGTLTATVTPENATDKTVTWTSSDQDVATVSETGVVTAVSVGTATITATAGEKTATCTITVNPIAVTGITIGFDSSEGSGSSEGSESSESSGSSPSAGNTGSSQSSVNQEASVSVVSFGLKVGENKTLTATVTPENATDKTVTWTSSDQDVVTVSETGVVTAVSVGEAIVTATAGGKTASCTVVVKPIEVNGITLSLGGSESSDGSGSAGSVKSLELIVGGSETLAATVTPENATDKTVTWTSGKPEIATVSEIGVVTAVSVGEATITATAGEETAICTVAVKPVAVTGITLILGDSEGSGSTGSSEKFESLELIVGKTETLIAIVTPENATDKTVTWTSDKPAVATVSEAGQITAISVGEATITAKAGEKTTTCTVTVNPILVDGISLSYGDSENIEGLELLVGGTATLTAAVTPENATDKTVTWTSDKPAVATVSEAGQITAKSVGEATITAKAGEKTATCTVTVNPILVDGISLSYGDSENIEGLELLVDGTATLTATVTPENATDKTVTWTSDKPAVATVSEAGQITAKSVGEATITAKAGEKTAICAVTVTNPEPQTPDITQNLPSSITINSDFMVMYVDNTDISDTWDNVDYTPYNLTVSAEVSDGGTLSYQWYRADSETAVGVEIEDQTQSSFEIDYEVQFDNEEFETVYIYVIVTNTKDETVKQISSNRTKVEMAMNFYLG